jgi:hypothetical protein
MFGSEVLEVVIGVVFVFLVVSIICSSVREGLESLLKTRAAYLEHGIRELLGDRAGVGLAKAVYQHPLVNGLFGDDYKDRPARTRATWIFARGGNLPSYIPSKNFALAILDIAARGATGPNASPTAETQSIDLATIRQAATRLQSPIMQRMVIAAIDSAGGDIDKFRQTIEQWYDSAMDRVSGWYKRSTQWIIFGVAILTAVAMNVDIVQVARFLYTNDSARQLVVANAQAAATDTAFTNQTYKAARASLDAQNMPIGWNAAKREKWWLHIPGWLATALAASMGAPFWFDLLNKIMVIRSTVKPHEKSPEEASEDRQPKPRPKEESPREPSPRPTAEGGVVYAQGEHRDSDHDEDGCDLPFDSETPDDELPEARGGVATS